LVAAAEGAAEKFVADDPFVVNGLVARWTIRAGNDFFSSPMPLHRRIPRHCTGSLPVGRTLPLVGRQK
jgi:hypothetical protein